MLHRDLLLKFEVNIDKNMVKEYHIGEPLKDLKSKELFYRDFESKEE